jgi:hypothetical protein
MTTWVSVLEQRGAARGEVVRAVVAHAHAGDLELAADIAAVEVRHEPGRGTQQR